MHYDPAEMLGLVAGFFGSFAYAPQAVKLLRTRDASSVSALTYTFVVVAAALWAIYGILRAAPSIVLWNVVAGLLAALVLVLKLRASRGNISRRA